MNRPATPAVVAAAPTVAAVGPDSDGPSAGVAVACGRCEHAQLRHWWGPGTRSHCGTCHRDWASLNEAHCTGCHRHFSSVRSFEFHLTDDACHDPQTVTRQDGRPRFVTTVGTGGALTWHAPRYDRRTRPWGGAPAA